MFFAATSGLPSRTKYVIDPSVQSNQYGIRNNYAPPNPMLPSMPPTNTINPSLFQTNAVTNTPAPNNFNTFQSSTMNNPLIPNATNPFLSNNNPPLTPNNGAFNQNTSTLPNNQPTEMGQSAMNVLPPNVTHGWNDPPAIQKSTRLPQVSVLFFIFSKKMQILTVGKTRELCFVQFLR